MIADSQPKYFLFLLIILFLAVAAYQTELENIAVYRSVTIGTFIALYKHNARTGQFTDGYLLSTIFLLLNIAYDWSEISGEPEIWWHLIVTKALMYIGGIYGAYWGAHWLQGKIRVRRQNFWSLIFLCAVVCSVLGAVGGEFVWQLKCAVFFE